MSTTEPGEQDYAEVAQSALERGDFALALEQIGAALSFDPTSDRHLRLLDAVLKRCARPLELLPSSGSAFFGAAAIRAYVLQRLGRLDEALAQLLDVVRFRPDAPYLCWIDDWCPHPRSLRGVSIERQASASMLFLSSADRSKPSGGLHRNLDALDRLLERLQERGSSAPPRLLLARSIVLRRRGRSREALEMLHAKMKKSSETVELLAQVGYASTECGLDGSTALERAARMAPDRVDAWLDLGDCQLDIGRLEPAAAAYERALALQPDARGQHHATLALDYIRFRLGVSAAPPSTRSRDVPTGFAETLEQRATAYRSRLPPPVDPLAAAVTHFVRRASVSDGEVRMRIRRAPPSIASARHLVGRALRSRGIVADIVVTDGPALEPLGDGAGEPADPELTREAMSLRTAPFDLPALVDPGAGPALSLTDARRWFDAFDGHSDDPVASLDHHRLAVLIRLARMVESETCPELVWLTELARGQDPWPARIAWMVLGALTVRHAWGRRVMGVPTAELEDARTPARLCALLSLPSLASDERRATYVELREWERRSRRPPSS
jgi:tetratricopeptide (TPR) repeat protein